MKFFLLALLLVCFTSPKAQENKKFINITGTSEVILPADQMNFSVQVKTISESVDESKKTNDIHMNELMTLLKNTGIRPNDITTSPISIGKNYETHEKERIQKGFFTAITVSFLLVDLSKYYELTNKLSSSNSFDNVNSSYAISDYELQNKLAIQKALKLAKEKAEYMSNSLGLKLGDVLEIDENAYTPNYYSSNSLNSNVVIDSQSYNISGKVTIRKSVRVKFAIN
jgi:uncharacterized protein YggE